MKDLLLEEISSSLTKNWKMVKPFLNLDSIKGVYAPGIQVTVDTIMVLGGSQKYHLTDCIIRYVYDLSRFFNFYLKYIWMWKSAGGFGLDLDEIGE